MSVQRGGYPLTKQCPVLFTPDSKRFLCCCDRSIHVYSCTTGQNIVRLERHVEPTTWLCLNPLNAFQVISCGLDGIIAFWDYSDGTLMKEIELDRPVYFISTSTSGTSNSREDKPKLVYVSSAEQSKAKNRRMVYEMDLKTASKVRTEKLSSSSGTFLTEFRASSGHFCIDRSGRLVAACHGDSVQIWDSHSEEMFKYDHSYPLTAAEFHPTDLCLATGDFKGAVTLWYQICRTDGHQPAKVSLHWHAHAVADICFNPDGSYLYSGGEEAVLVAWQVETKMTRFLPRLGAPIKFISCSDNSLYLGVSHNDNIIQLVSGHQLDIERMVGGLIKPMGMEGLQYGTCIPAGLTVEPHYNCLVTNSRPGEIQFYSPWTDQHVMSIDVTGRNTVSRREDKPVVYTQVTNVAFSDCKNWMATVEHRDDRETTMELTLKFWQFVQEKQGYDVNTTIELPHPKQITSVQFWPQQNETSPAMCISASVDGKVKFWSQSSGESAEGTSFEWWACQAVTYYHNLPALDACFSEDGSLVAVAFGRVVMVLNSSTAAFLTTLSCPFEGEQVIRVLFGHKSALHCLVATSQSHLMVWNTLTYCLLWSVSLSIGTIVACPQSEFCGAFAHDGTHQVLVMFSPQDPKPLAKYDEISDHKVEAAVFIPQPPYIARQLAKSLPRSDQWRQQVELVWIDSEQVIRSLPWPESVKAERAERLDTTMTGEETSTAFTGIFGTQQPTTSTGPPVRLDAASQTATMRSKMLSGPSHTLPALSSISLKYLQSFLAQRPQPGDEDEDDKENGGRDQDSGLIKPPGSGSDTDDDSQLQVPEVPSSDSASAQLQTLPSVVTSLSGSQVGNFDWLEGVFSSRDVE